MTHPTVVQVGKFYPPHMGGIETYLQNLSHELTRSYEVHALVSNDGPQTVHEMDGPVHVHRIGTRLTISSASICPGFGHALRRLKPDLVHLHWPNPTATMAVLCSGYGGPIVTTYHSDVVRQKILATAFEPFLRAILHRSSAIVCTSQRYLETSRTASLFSEKCAVIPYGILPPETDVDVRDVLAIRQRFGPRIVMALGRLVYYKGFEYLIDAMHRVQGRLLIVGEGPLRATLERRVIDNELGSKVHFCGGVQNEQLAPLYRAADVFAFPSIARSEAFGIVQLEAMSYGLPVVNTQLDSGVPFVSRHNETGLTIPPCDSIALADALNAILLNQPLRAKFSAAARHRVRTEFALETMMRRTENLYEQVLSGAQWTPEAVPATLESSAGERSAVLPAVAAHHRIIPQ